MPTPRPVRYRCELFARLTVPSFPAAKVAVIELSESGALLEEPAGFDEIQVGDAATIEIGLPGGDAWKATALVSRLGQGRRELPHATAQHVTVSVPGLALEFQSMNDDDLEQLRGYLELLDER